MVDDDTEESTGPLHRALRKVMNEYDRSTPPVLPPMPFDVPKVPEVPFTGDKKVDVKARMKKLKKDKLHAVLKESYNEDAFKRQSQFLAAFREFEYVQASSCTIGQIGDLRQGQWLFLYAVLQSLPRLVVDAPAVKWTRGVEYFLCMPPRSGVPWAKTESERTYYAIGGNTNAVVSLPSDVIEFGIEGIYRRSHAWKAAEQWAQETVPGGMASAMVEETLGALPPPAPGFAGQHDLASPQRSRESSPARGSPRGDKRRSMMLNGGLEALPMPPGVFADSTGAGVGSLHSSPTGSPVLGPTRGSPKLRPASQQADASKTFDAILGSMDGGAKKGKKK